MAIQPSQSSDSIPASRPLAWGILGAARIARGHVAPAIREAGGQIVAVGASTLDRARAFAQELEIPQAFEGYQAVIENPQVEAVYIPLANGLHFPWALACAHAGKHCLCEKPLALRADDARALHEAFTQAGVRLMEGFMWRHVPRALWLEDQIRRGAIGPLRRVVASFSFPLDRPEDFRWRDDQGGGALWDIGCYCANAARLFFGEEPLAVSARSSPLRKGSAVDRSTVGWLEFDSDDRLATFDCSFTSSYRQELVLVGADATFAVPSPFRSSESTRVVKLVGGQPAQETFFEAANPYAAMVAHFTRAARDSSFALQPGEDGLKQASVMEALAASAAAEGAPRLLADF